MSNADFTSQGHRTARKKPSRGHLKSSARWIFNALLILISGALIGCAGANNPSSDTGDTRNTSDASDIVSNQDTSADASLEDDTSTDTNTPELLLLSSLSPTEGSTSGGITVLLDGAGFEQGLQVFFGEHEALVGPLTPTRVEVTSPPAFVSGPVDVQVINPGGASSTLPKGFHFLNVLPSPEIQDCVISSQGELPAQTGAPSPVIYASVLARGLTDQPGRGPDIIAELGFGTGADHPNFEFHPMAYNRDAAEGDEGNARDEYSASLIISTPRLYQYLARFKVTGDSDWTYCDRSSEDSLITPEQFGALRVEDPPPPSLDHCQLFAGAAIVEAGGSITVHASVLEEGITTGTGQGPGINAELGHGSNPNAHEDFSFFPMQYNADAGDADDYIATLTLPNPGEHHYVARFQTQGGAWQYCDLDGVAAGETLDTNQLGFVTVTPPPTSTVGFCRTLTQQLQISAGETSNPIAGEVFDALSTPGAGPGAGMDAELVWGPIGADPTTWSNTKVATYLGDLDGPTPGDLARDRYTATLVAPSAGLYGFAYRFRAADDSSWTYCDTSGTGPESPFQPDQVGTLETSLLVINLPDWCNLEGPEIASNSAPLPTGSTLTVYGRVFVEGTTDSSDGDSLITGALLVGPENTDPVADPSAFEVFPAFHNDDDALTGQANDEYYATYTPSSPGREAYFFRFSIDGGANWRLCDIDGSNVDDAFNPQSGGLLESFTPGSEPDLIDYCNIWQTDITGSTTSPLVTVELYEGGLTDSAADPSSIEAEAGYGLPGENPAIEGTFTWRSISYKGAPNSPQNYEYEGNAYDTPPAPGLYDVAARVRRQGTSTWTYCDTLNSTMPYDHSAATAMTVQ